MSLISNFNKPFCASTLSTHNETTYRKCTHQSNHRMNRFFLTNKCGIFMCRVYTKHFCCAYSCSNLKVYNRKRIFMLFYHRCNIFFNSSCLLSVKYLPLSARIPLKYSQMFNKYTDFLLIFHEIFSFYWILNLFKK